MNTKIEKHYPRLHPTRKSGDEPLHSNGRSLEIKLLDFWRFSSSDLVSNSTRGVLAEFIVACALGVDLDTVRDEWGAYDLSTTEGITVEVKSAAYIQSWHQKALSPIKFRIPKTQAWNADTGVYELERRRQAQVYVFALLAHTDKPTIDPLNVNQWKFYVLPTSILDTHVGHQKEITEKRLEALAGQPINYDELREAVISAIRKKTSE